MSKRKPDVYLQDILESIEYIQRFLDGISEEEFYKNNDLDCSYRGYCESER